MSLQSSRVPRSYWRSTENRRNFLDEIAKKLNINTPSDWGKVSVKRFYELRGGSILSYYNNSLFVCLQSVYKDTNWKREWFSNLDKLPKSYWKSIEIRKNFLDKVAKQLNIKTPSDWGKVTNRRFCELGVSSLLKYYNGSLFACLQSVYKDTNWKIEWFDNLPKSYWKSMENRRNFLDEIAKKLNINTPSDWGKITVQQFKELGGSSLLKYYNGSLSTCLQSVYKDTNWKIQWFSKYPKLYWKSIENRRNFLDKVAKQLNIKTPSDWGKVTWQYLREVGGTTLLGYYNNSLFECLQSIYKDTNWKREWFRIVDKRYPQNHFQSFENQFTFFDTLAQQYNLQEPSDWKMISLNLIKKRGGGTLLARYNNSISNALNAVYPSMNLLLSQNASFQQKKTIDILQKQK